MSAIAKAGKLIQDLCHEASKLRGWWNDPVTGEDLINSPRVVEQKLLLVHSEISEGVEGHRRNLKDDKLPHRPMLEVELADAVIRIMDLAGALGYNIGEAIQEKMDYNATRADHSKEARSAANGKSF